MQCKRDGALSYRNHLRVNVLENKNHENFKKIDFLRLRPSEPIVFESAEVPVPKILPWERDGIWVSRRPHLSGTLKYIIIQNAINILIHVIFRV